MKARQTLLEEMDLVKIIQQLRFFNVAIELLMTQESALNLRNETAKQVLSDKDDEPRK